MKIPLSIEKTEGPNTELEYLGIYIETINMIAWLPNDKIDRISEIVESFLHCISCTKR